MYDEMRCILYLKIVKVYMWSRVVTIYMVEIDKFDTLSI